MKIYNYKGFIMVSSSTTASAATTDTLTMAVGAQQKAQDVQTQQAMKILENLDQQTQQTTAQKTGLGTSLNLKA
jgi:hypothetical protein